MRVLVISRNAWDDTNSIGNTLSNFFQNMEGVEFANIYFRSAKPNNSVCKHYYRVTESEIIRKWFSPHKIGKAFEWGIKQEDEKTKLLEINEKRIIQLVHKCGIKFAYKISNSLWYSKKWINNNFDRFINTFSPDIVVAFVKSAPQYYLTIKYLREKFGIPLFSWIADDEYTFLSKKQSKKEINNLKYILNESSVVRGCSEEICEYYNALFGCNATPLYKGCNLSNSIKDSNNFPIKIVYAGNLLYGRLEIIKKISAALEKYNNQSQDVSLEIYSNTLISSDDKLFFDRTKSSKYLGQESYNIIKQRLSKADIVLHVESFDESQILKTKYSFSTKIVDCLQSGSVLLAIGPAVNSSIKYVKKIPGAFVIDNLDHLEKTLYSFLLDHKTFTKRAEEIRMFAIKNHDSKVNTEILLETFGEVTKKGI